MRIVTVSYIDDNFGDNLIRVTFQALLEVALTNHQVAPDEYEIIRMALKAVDEDLLATADIIYFTGGGLFGLSYLGFYPHVDQITEFASRRGIPVVFSSMGLNNMGATGDQADPLATILSRSCVKSISVREDLELFTQAAAGTDLQVTQVADPAVWTKYVYGMTDVESDGTLGINVVRGGLFVANDRAWGLTAEMNYLSDLARLTEDADLRSQFYTNGSLDDNNTLRYFASERGISPTSVVLPQSTREVVAAIASRSSIASIRMHSSIIAYSFGIPTVALAWNDKLAHFYSAIGHPERLIPFGEWTAERSFTALQNATAVSDEDPQYRDYLMSTYAFIYRSVGEHLLRAEPVDSSIYSFDIVAAMLVNRAPQIDEDEFDLRVKLGKAERAYLKRFIALRGKNREIQRLRRQGAEAEAQIAVLAAQVAALTTDAGQPGVPAPAEPNAGS